MINSRFHLILIAVSIFALLWVKPASALTAGPPIEAGVSKQLATYRKSILSKIRYTLDLDIPATRSEGIGALEVLTFQLKTNIYPLQIDFREDPSKIKSIKVNNVPVPVKYLKEHIIVSTKYLKTGANEIKFEFQAGEAALNRNADYLYSLFVPDRARTVFPCFDQPDLKAIYTLTLKIPLSWKAIANAPLKDSLVQNGRKTYRFMASDLLSTYLFAFAAGKFEQVQGDIANKKVDFLYRETDTAKINASIPEIFNIQNDALQYYEQWTGIPYPFQKFGFVAIPDFQFGGMEHVGAIQYKSSSLFLDSGATQDQLDTRHNLLAHETAHMWFGDLVTMNWFTDVWMKEVFANFMADKSMEASTSSDDYDLKFLVDHFPAAYNVDRTTGSNPIRQDLDNLKDAGTLYGNIIYHKAPIMMCQLERLMGKDRFQMGVREYLKKYTNSNASWPELISILSKYTDADLANWNKVWVNETGRPIIDYTLETKDNKISKFVITQRPEYGAKRIWPQLFEVTFFYPDYSRELTISLESAQINLNEAVGIDKPLFVLFNSSGQGYGLWPVDTAMFSRIYRIEKPLKRATAYISMYENMLSGTSVKPPVLLKLLIEGLGLETEELNLKLLTNYIGSVFWNFTSAADRSKLAGNLESSLWEAMNQQTAPNNKKLLFKAYQNVFLSSGARDHLYEIWKSQKAPEGLKLTEDDYTSLAFSLALRNDSDTSILSQQLLRITNADRKKRFEFIMPALSSKEAERDNFFKSLEQKSNREKESSVATALSYLHHPLRQQYSIKYLAKSLDMLEEIQTSGDIFFPDSWLQATFGSYQSKEAADIVRGFLKAHPVYNPKLKAKILQAADNLFRAERLVK